MSPVDAGALDLAVRRLNAAMAPCAGGFEVREVDADGNVRLALTGMCTGCVSRPLTLAGHLRPALRQVPGVGDVEVLNSRISRHAEQRLARLLADEDTRGARSTSSPTVA